MKREIARDIILATIQPSCPCVGCPDYCDEHPECSQACKRLARWRDERAAGELSERGARLNTLENRIFMMFIGGKSIGEIAWHFGITQWKVKDAIRIRQRKGRRVK